MSLVILIVMFGALWAFLILPQQRRMKAHRELLAAVEVGDEVLLSSGIYGQIADFDGDSVFVAVSDNLEIKVTKESITERVVYADPAELDAAQDDLDDVDVD